MKRLVDIICSSIGVLFLSPLFVVVAVLIRLDSPGPVFFRQNRIGKDFRPFRIYKFRTMAADAEQQGAPITVGGDKRITRIGGYLRKYKIDELPQLFNVIKGEMSLVGPRPEIRKYVEQFRTDYAKLLTVRPGITDPASLHYSDEERLLASSTTWEDDYLGKVLPEKIRLSSGYVDNHTIFTDLRLILKTITKASHQ